GALVVRTNVGSGTWEIGRAFAPTTLTNVTVTATTSQSVVSSLTVMSFTGVDTSGTNGSGAIGATASGSGVSGAPTASLVTTRAGSWVFGVGNDYDNPIARTVPSGQTLVHQYLAPIGDTYWVQRQNSPAPGVGNSIGISDTAPTTDQYNLSICEILPAIVPATFNVSGTISPAAGGSGASVTLTGGLTAVADASGSYTITNVPNGSYTATPQKAGYTFAPPNQLVTVNNGNVSGVNFTAQPVVTTVSIFGTISPVPPGRTTLTLSGASSATTNADLSGNY